MKKSRNSPDICDLVRIGIRQAQLRGDTESIFFDQEVLTSIIPKASMCNGEKMKKASEYTNLHDEILDVKAWVEKEFKYLSLVRRNITFKSKLLDGLQKHSMPVYNTYDVLEKGKKYYEELSKIEHPNDREIDALFNTTFGSESQIRKNILYLGDMVVGSENIKDLLISSDTDYLFNSGNPEHSQSKKELLERTDYLDPQRFRYESVCRNLVLNQFNLTRPIRPQTKKGGSEYLKKLKAVLDSEKILY